MDNLKNYISTLETGKRPKGGAKSEGIPSLGGEHINRDGKFNLDKDSLKYVPVEYYNEIKRGKLKINDVLVVKDGATTGKTAIIEKDFPLKEACINEHVFLLRTNEKLNPKYLYYYFLSSEGQSNILKDFRGATIGGISKNFIDINMFIPTLDKQKKIVEVLDKSQSLIDKKREQIELLDELVKSRFIEIFGDIRINEKGWEEKEISNLLISIDSGKSFVCEGYERKGEYPAILKLSAVTYGVYNPLENKALIDANEFIDNMEVKEGDLLFTRKNTPELVGMCAYVYKTTPNLMMPDLIFRLNTNENCNKIYLWKLINNEMFREKIKMISNGSAKSMSNISKQNLMKLKVPVPPIELQNEFAEFVTQTDSIRSKMEASLSELEDNFNSLMQKALKGELFN